MKPQKIIIALGIVASLVGCGVSQNNRIIIKEEPRRENFTNKILRNFIKKQESPRIVVRSTGTTGSISSSSGSDRICSILETALAKNKFDVRDRSLFEAVANSHGKNGKTLTYEELGEATGVDLLMEIANYSLADYYTFDGYYNSQNRFVKFEPVNEGDKRHPIYVKPRYILRGMSITIKVILLKDNLVGGSYSYSYVPCSEESGGALITQLYPLRYIPNKESRDIDAILDDDQNAGLIERQSQRLDRAMEDFLSNVVVPGMMADIKGEVYANERPVGSNNDSQGFRTGNSKSETYAGHSNEEQNSTVSVDDLMEKYHIEGLISQYARALSEDHKDEVDKVSKQIADAKQAVFDDAALSFKVKNEFYNKVTLKAKDAKATAKQQLRAKKKELQKEAAQEIPKERTGKGETQRILTTEEASGMKERDMFASIVPINSFGKISSAVSTLVGQLAQKQLNNKKDLVKKQKEIDNLEAEYVAKKTDLDKWDYLESGVLADINQFVITSVSPSGINMPLDQDAIILYLPMLLEKTEPDLAFYVFLDGDCVGVGSQIKGFYINMGSRDKESTFHDLRIYSSNVKTHVKACVFDSTVSFAIKTNYNFIREEVKGQFKGLKLQ